MFTFFKRNWKRLLIISAASSLLVAIPLTLNKKEISEKSFLLLNKNETQTVVKDNSYYLTPLLNSRFSKQIKEYQNIPEKELEFVKNTYVSTQNLGTKNFLYEQEILLALYNATVYYRDLFPTINIVPTTNTVDSNDAAFAFFNNMQNNWYRIINNLDKLYFVGYSAAVSNLKDNIFQQEQADKYGWIYKPKSSKIIDSYLYEDENENEFKKSFYFQIEDFSVYKIEFIIAKNTNTYLSINPTNRVFERFSYSVNFEPIIFKIFNKQNVQIKSDIKLLADHLEKINLYNSNLTDEEKTKLKDDFDAQNGQIISYVLTGAKNE
ncbi:hypothetical protein CJJ23_01400 [Mycoplasmopsis agassizii]|uniref:Aromatic cluster surface protein n=1 Tax=Mycoplasmopsis agassizii TaxID=33922 RepID=A0A269TJM6_9BACT|nr:hypothetical protein [Mycoplasmopsis agassizii]PAK21587.1 hypothetical protein CJJ23_01400 [Mycoplasmopsis agassizii]